MRWGLCLVALTALTGCASGPANLPMQQMASVPECRWPLANGDRVALLRDAVEVLEAEGFSVVHTDTTLGVISAERQRVLPGYGTSYDDRWPRRGGWYGGHHVGSGGRLSIGSGVGSGIGVGIGVGGGSVGYGYGFPMDATRVDRISLVAPGEWVMVSQDSRVIDAEGAVRESRSGGDVALCRELQRVTASVTDGASRTGEEH